MIDVSSPTLDSLMHVLQIKSIKRPFYFAKNEFLRQIYEFYFEEEADYVYSEFSKYNDLFGDVEFIYKPKGLYDPADYMWQHTIQDSLTDDYLWSLLKIEADKAWNITKGDPSLVVAVVDNGFDINHPDLNTSIYPPYDFYTNNALTTSLDSHGTTVASILAAETVDQGETPIGDMASIGYNTKIMASTGYLPACVYASTVLDAKLLSISWFHSCSSTQIMLEAEREILNNGTIIVKGAGNGTCHCNGGKLYPFSGYEDSRVIVVSSTDFNDYHYNSNGETHSHYPEIDICAPGYSVMGAINSHDIDNNPIDWPYYGQSNGTSFAAPLVAGVCALVLSLNPCFAPEDVQDIIKNSADPITDAADFPGLVGAGRINAYQALLLAQAYLVVDTITGNTTWNQKKHLYDDLVIDSLATLTITDTLYIAGGSRIIVRPGGKLIVNGGTLTSACDGEMWEGIIVEGHNNIRQAALAQGSVILNNATIENAKEAILTRGADTNAVYEHTGGIVQATNTLFRNNWRSAGFLQYENHTSGGAVTNNASYFTRCTFTVDDDNLFVAQGRDFENHVTMWRVRGVKFNGCSFRNEMSGTASRGKAISTIEAGFNAKRVCPTISPVDPCVCENHGTDTVTRCSFIGFDTAVHTSSTLGNYDITLDNCDFAQNLKGGLLSVADNDRISFCDFDLDFTVNANTGLFLKNCTGYTVEDNVFKRSTYLTSTSVGICCDNSGTSENVIRRNEFFNLNYGCYVQNQNATSGMVRPQSGLQFNCNSFDDCKMGIYVRSGAKMRISQGSASVGADNVFGVVQNSGRSLTVPSDHSSVKYYRSSGGNHQPIGTSNYTVQNATANGCASTICGIHIDNPIVHGLNGGVLPQYQSMAEHLGHLQEQYENIQDLESEEAVALQSEMSDLSAAMSELARAEIRGIISDSVPDLDLLKDWYKAINTPLTHYLMAETQSTEGLWDKARATLEDIPVRFELDDSEKDEYTQYGSLQSLREAVSGNWYKLGASQIAQMQQVAESGNGRAARMAKEILCFFHHICYEEAPFWDEKDQTEFGTRGLAVGKADPDNALTLSPNPANSTVTLQLADPQDEIRQITVANMQGQVMLSQTVNATTPYTLDISSLPAGIYVVRVLTANGQALTGKVVKE